MPNWCMNKVEFDREPVGIDEFLVSSDSGAMELDAMKLMPPPGGVYDYDWCVENWGSKWEPIELKLEGTTMTFDSAWSPPIGVYAALQERVPEATFEAYWADEGCDDFDSVL